MQPTITLQDHDIMAAVTKNILIFGATGSIGTHITNAILNSKENFGKISIFTSQETVSKKSDVIEKLKSRGASIITGDITSESDVTSAYNGFDTIVSAVGRPVIDKQEKLIKLADQHPDVKRFFPSEYGTDIEYDETSASEKPHQMKLGVRALLKTVKNLEYTYVVTGPYADADGFYLAAKKPENEAQGSFDVQRKRAVLLGDGNGKISLTTMRDVGKLVVAALLHPDASKNKALRVNSFTTTPHELAAEFQKQTGGEKWSIGYTSLEELKKLESQNPVVTLKRIWTSGKTLYTERDNHLIDAEEGLDDLSSTVAEAIEVQRRRIAEGTLY